MRTLKERIAFLPQVGELTWLGVRPAHEAPMESLEEALLLTEKGIRGDRASKTRLGGKRQVTLIQEEHLPVIAAFTRSARIDPAQLRRNLVVRGINLVALKGLTFRVGAEVILQGTGPCEPCAKMDVALGEGGFQAMRGHGGITARVLVGGIIRRGDRVQVESAPNESAPND